MLVAAPLDFFIRFSDVYLLSAEGGTAFPTDNPAAECIPALIDCKIINALFLPAVFIKLTYRLRFLSGYDRLMVVCNQVLWQFCLRLLWGGYVSLCTFDVIVFTGKSAACRWSWRIPRAAFPFQDEQLTYMRCRIFSFQGTGRENQPLYLFGRWERRLHTLILNLFNYFLTCLICVVSAYEPHYEKPP